MVVPVLPRSFQQVSWHGVNASIERWCRRNRTLIGTSERRIFDMNGIEETFRPMRRLDRLKYHGITLATDGHRGRGESEFLRQRHRLTVARFDEFCSLHEAVPFANLLTGNVTTSAASRSLSPLRPRDASSASRLLLASLAQRAFMRGEAVAPGLFLRLARAIAGPQQRFAAGQPVAECVAAVAAVAAEEHGLVALPRCT